MPPAPPTFSITICWPRISLMRGVTIRVNTSAGPPAANGTITVIGRDGYVCADASSVVAKIALKPTAKALIRIGGPPWDGGNSCACCGRGQGHVDAALTQLG